MLVSLAFPIMSAVRHKSGSLIYEFHGVNFMQDFEGIFATGYVPGTAANTPYLVIARNPCDDKFFCIMFDVILSVQYQDTQFDVIRYVCLVV